jgi:Zn-dependent peptidase ImmA (M78 family)
VRAVADPVELASQVRREWGVGESQSLDILNLLSTWEGISIVRTTFGDASRASGLFARRADSTLIVLNSSRTLGHQLFTAAHEYYHVRFSEGMSGRICITLQPQGKQPDELMADQFAANLLVPDGGIRAMLSRYATDSEPSWPTILRLEQHFRVSHQAMLWRLWQVDYFINREQMEEYAKGVRRQAHSWGLATELYHADAGHQVISDVPLKVRRALELGLISQGWAGELLDAMGAAEPPDGGSGDGLSE